MTSLLEFSARAELCRKFAKLEPHASCVWLAEAARWSRLIRERAVINEDELFQGSPTRAASIEMIRGRASGNVAAAKADRFVVNRGASRGG